MIKLGEWLKKLIKNKKILIVAIIVIIVIAFIVSRFLKSNKIEYITEKVVKENLTQTVSETGSLKAASEINLNFKGTGTITEIKVKEGEEVKKGDVLARLDAGQLEIQVRQAEANLAMSQANLDRFLAGARTEERKVSEESVNNAKIAYENAKINHQALLAKLESDIKNTSQQIIMNSRDNLMTSLESSLTLMDHSVDVMKNIVEYQSFGRYFSISNPQLKNDFYQLYDYFYLDTDAAKASYNQAKNSQVDNDIEQAYLKVTSVLEKTRQILDQLFAGLSATVSSADISQTVLDGWIASVKLEQNTTNNSIATLNGANQAWTNAKNNLEVVLSTKDMQIASSQAQVDNALGAYNLAKAQYELTIAPPRKVDVAYYQAQVAQSQSAYELALSNLDDYIIYAPIDGKVVFVNNEVGEQIGFGVTNIANASQPVITLLGKGDFEVEVDVPESDIIKVKVGNQAKITLDAYGEDVIFNGTVVFIDLASTSIQDVVYYKVKVALEPTTYEIKQGMTANIDLETAQKSDVLVIPARALKEDTDGKKYVEILVNGQVERKEITIGLRGDQGIEVTSGLSENEEIIVYKNTP
jgi:HlyD family secretion protein